MDQIFGIFFQILEDLQNDLVKYKILTSNNNSGARARCTESRFKQAILTSASVWPQKPTRSKSSFGTVSSFETFPWNFFDKYERTSLSQFCKYSFQLVSTPLKTLK